jgi:non-lysosomal glucosylceramidase
MSTSRRLFLKNGSLFLSAVALSGRSAWAVPPMAFPRHNIPADKKLNPAWVKSLYDRGKPTTYLKSRRELAYLGMPVGGLHAGTVYLGGDGRLWLWGIYNQSEEGKCEGIDPKTVRWDDGQEVRSIRSRDGSAYVEPAIANNKRTLEQGFAIRVRSGKQSRIKELNEADWKEVAFEAGYPVATVRYTDPDFPVEVTLKAYSPFIPLDAENSSYPASILRISVQNQGKEEVTVDLLGWMENGASKLSAKPGNGEKRNTVFRSDGLAGIFSDYFTEKNEVKTAADFGSTAFGIRNKDAKVLASLTPWPVTDSHFEGKEDVPVDGKLVGGLTISRRLAPGKRLNEDFVIGWHFNQPKTSLKNLVSDANAGYYYGTRFADARAVLTALSRDFEKLSSLTERWAETWTDSTLPHWFLERTFVNIGTLATANTYRFASGRFWAWEGVGACAGTCTHVWQYAQAMARIFPELERGLRQHVDLGVGFRPDSGAIIFRAENESRPAIDGQAGTVLRCYREHQVSADSRFLSGNWPAIKKAVSFVLAQDKNGDGMVDTPMENTLDAVWEGEIAWIVGLCIAAVRAGQAMAEEMQDTAFAAVCARFVQDGQRNMEEKLFNGEYFIHRPDAAAGRSKLGSYNTCHIDQVFGQSWAFQVGLPRVLDRQKSLQALRALWKYNFAPDVGPYIKTHVGGRPYALAGESGMIMNTNPANEPKPYGENVTWQLGYFHECMSGFEHQVAAHLMAEGMTDEALILTRAIHDRYHAAKRNPYNEIECSDHYARAMASYGTFLMACGFEYHGPKGYLALDPKIHPEKFRAPFTAAEGWGTFSQQRDGKVQRAEVIVRYGKLRLNELVLSFSGSPVEVVLEKDGKRLPLRIRHMREGERLKVVFDGGITIEEGATLRLRC